MYISSYEYYYVICHTYIYGSVDALLNRITTETLLRFSAVESYSQKTGKMGSYSTVMLYSEGLCCHSVPLFSDGKCDPLKD